MRIDASGNVGIGVTPSAWGSTYKVLDVGGGASFAGLGNSAYITSNSYDNGTNYIYKATAASTLYLATSGQHRWYNAPSGTAGNAITFTQAMTLDASGNLGIGTSSPTSRLTISGVAATGATTILSTGTTTNYNVGQFTNTGGNLYYGIDNSGGTAFSGSTAYGSIIGSGNSTNLHLVTNSIVRATLDASGNVGIGTSSPATKLQVAGVANAVFFENPKTITANYTITTGSNAMAAGPITIASGITVTIPSGSVWTVV
jgi:hypothetical protein